MMKLARKAGEEILAIYNSNDFDVQIKDDESLLTKADLRSNEIIKEGLKESFDFPILTEESPVEYQSRKQWTKFWLVDPLDGTKDFIEKNDEFTINIALIEDGKPILGLLYAPAIDLLYYAEKGKGAFLNGKQIFNRSSRKQVIGTDSRHHSTKETMSFFERNKITEIKKYGSALKFGKLAEGAIDIYPRLNGTKEWDTAAGHIICNEAGCSLMDYETKKEMIYNKVSIKNNFFIAHRNELHFLV